MFSQLLTKLHSMKRFSIILVFLAKSLFSIAQTMYPYTVPVIENGQLLKNAFAGGVNQPQFSPIDLNFDGIQDIVIFDKNGFIIMPFIQAGMVNSSDWRYDPQYIAAFPPLHEWVLLRDYNCDGKADIFTSGENYATIDVYQNTSTVGNLSFAQTPISALTFDSDTIRVATYDIPAIIDIDNDSDLDILTFDTQGWFVQYFKNTSQENAGNCSQLTYTSGSACWGNFREDGLNNTITLNVTCKTDQIINTYDQTRHAGSSICAYDEGGDGDKDLLLGDISFNNIVYLGNGGDINYANMNFYEYEFPESESKVELYAFPVAYYLDGDFDGKNDVIITPNLHSSNYENVIFMQNIGNNTNHSFQEISRTFLQNTMIDCGSAARPVFFDEDSDGKLDIIIGNDRYKTSESNEYTGLTLYRNTGTTVQPQFTLVDRNYLDLKTMFNSLITGIGSAHPTFGDIDGDGDKDMILGDYEGRVHFLQNNAAAGNPAAFVLMQQNYFGIDVGAMAMPQLVDLNKDGKLDLVVGEQMGNLSYYENTGTATNPIFSATPNNAFFGGIDVNPVCCQGFGAPYFFQNASGNFELLLGTENGNIWHYNNIDNNLTGNFTKTTSTFGDIQVGARSTISGGDVNNDGITDYLVGNMRGGIGFYSLANIFVASETAISATNWTIYPNPTTNNVCNMRFDAGNGAGEIRLFSIDGKALYSQSIAENTKEITLQVPHLQAGIYIWKWQHSGTVEVKKWVAY